MGFPSFPYTRTPFFSFVLSPTRHTLVRSTSPLTPSPSNTHTHTTLPGRHRLITPHSPPVRRASIITAKYLSWNKRNADTRSLLLLNCGGNDDDDDDNDVTLRRFLLGFKDNTSVSYNGIVCKFWFFSSSSSSSLIERYITFVVKVTSDVLQYHYERLPLEL